MPRDGDDDVPDPSPRQESAAGSAAELLGRVGGIVPVVDGWVDVTGHARALRGMGPAGLVDLAAACERATAYLAWLGSRALAEALTQETGQETETAAQRGVEQAGPGGVFDPAGDRDLARSCLVAEAALACGISEHLTWARIHDAMELARRLPQVDAAQAAGRLSGVKARIAREIAEPLTEQAVARLDAVATGRPDPAPDTSTGRLRPLLDPFSRPPSRFRADLARRAARLQPGQSEQAHQQARRDTGVAFHVPPLV